MIYFRGDGRMKYVDYREKLGIGFNDEQKRDAIENIIRNFFSSNRTIFEATNNTKILDVAKNIRMKHLLKFMILNFQVL